MAFTSVENKPGTNANKSYQSNETIACISGRLITKIISSLALTSATHALNICEFENQAYGSNRKVNV
jgi:hypothetical protein